MPFIDLNYIMFRLKRDNNKTATITINDLNYIMFRLKPENLPQSSKFTLKI